MTPTDEQLREIRERLEDARKSGLVFVRRHAAPDDPMEQGWADFTNFQAHAPTDIRTLLDAIAELQAVVADFKEGARLNFAVEESLNALLAERDAEISELKRKAKDG